MSQMKLKIFNKELSISKIGGKISAYLMLTYFKYTLLI